MATTRAENLKGYATFHGGLTTPEGQSYQNQKTPLLIMHGGADSSITMMDVAALAEELEASGTPYEIQVYSGAPHAFTVFGADRYQDTADQESWNAFQRLSRQDAWQLRQAACITEPIAVKIVDVVGTRRGAPEVARELRLD